MLDSLEITVLVEDHVPMHGPFLAQHGLSLLLKGVKDGVETRGLLDVGQSHEILTHNMKGLGVAPESIDFLALSHCHYDHTGGVAAFVCSTGKSDFPVIAHPDLFRPHFTVDPSLAHIGVGSADALKKIEEAGGRVILSAAPVPLAEGMASTGEVPRATDFEGPGKRFFTVRDGKTAQDSLPDDMAVTARVRGHGVVVAAGCCHSGIVNILKHVRALYPDEPVEGIVGGLHLVNASEEKMEKTASGIREFAPRWIGAGHCTGFPMQAKLLRDYGMAFTPLAVGATFRVGG